MVAEFEDSALLKAFGADGVGISTAPMAGEKEVCRGPDHVGAVLDLLRRAGGAGNLATDAQIAAVALHHRATVYTNDSDFARFAGVQTRNPLHSSPELGE